MKNIWKLIPMILGILLVCCSSDDTQEVTAKITVTPNPLTVAAEGGDVTITVTADAEWGIYSPDAWISCKPTGGLSGTSKVVLTIKKSDSDIAARTGSIIIKSGSTRLSVPVTQDMLIEELPIADPNLKAYLLANYDTNGDGIFSKAEARAIETLAIPDKKIASFAELSAFTGLASLDCSKNTIPELTTKALTGLISLNCSNNALKGLDIKTNTKLTVLDCTGNEIDKILVWAGFTPPAGFKIPAGAQYVLPDVFIPEGYKLVWSDEFEGTSLNSANWNVETGNGSGGWGNAELEYYTNSEKNLSVKDGSLIITAIKETQSGFPATSARIQTLEKVFFKYGYIVASIKIPKTANGLWPAFWMMGNDFAKNGWPKCGETDILEMGNSGGIAAGTQEKYLNGACHWGTSYANHVTYDYSVQDGKYHTFTCIWDEKTIAMYIDLETHPTAKPYFKMDIPESIVGDAFHKDNFILFNLAVGGNFPGIHDIGGVTGLSSGSASMSVDYVRVFQKK